MTEKDKLTISSEPTQSERLNLSGGIHNLMPTPISFSGCPGQYPCAEQMGPAYVSWKDGLGDFSTLTMRLLHNAEHVQWKGEIGVAVDQNRKLSHNVEVIGGFNDGYIDLVRPTIDTTPMVEFWRKAVREDGARTVGLPDMKALRKQHGMAMYCIVPASVALVAYFRYEELERLLIPVLPVEGNATRYGALMPAEQLIQCSSIQGRFWP